MPSKKKRTRKSYSKPIGLTKIGKSYAIVFGSKKKPRFSSSRFRTKKAAINRIIKIMK